MVAMADIEAFCRQVGATFHPRRIILFGSHATGSARRDSDVDLLIEVDRRSSGPKAAAEIIRTLRPTFGVDLIVRSRQDITARLQQKDSFLGAVFRKGRVLYESPD